MWPNFLVFLVAYLASLNEPDVTELALHEYKTATNMTEQFAALVALSQNAGKVRDDALLDFYNQWQNDYLVRCIHTYMLILFALLIMNKSSLCANVAWML